MITKKIFFIFFSCLLGCTYLLLINVSIVSADTCLCTDGNQSTNACGPDCTRQCQTHGRVQNCEPSSTSGGSGGGSVSLDNPLPTGTNINEIIGKAINGVLGIVGSLALVMVIYGGLTWMLAAGNQTRVQKGRDILVWAVVGLIVIFSAYAMVRFVFVNIFGASGTTTSAQEEALNRGTGSH